MKLEKIKGQKITKEINYVRITKKGIILVTPNVANMINLKVKDNIIFVQDVDDINNTIFYATIVKKPIDGSYTIKVAGRYLATSICGILNVLNIDYKTNSTKYLVSTIKFDNEEYIKFKLIPNQTIKV